MGYSRKATCPGNLTYLHSKVFSHLLQAPNHHHHRPPSCPSIFLHPLSTLRLHFVIFFRHKHSISTTLFLVRGCPALNNHNL